MATPSCSPNRCRALVNSPLSPYRLSAKTTLKRKPKATSSSTIAIANCGLLVRTSPGLRRASGLKTRNRRGKVVVPRAEHTIGIDRDHAVRQCVQIADILVGDVVGGVSLLAVPRLVQAQDEGRVPQRLAQQLQPLGAHRLHGPVGVGQEMVQRLGVSVDRRAQAWQRLVPRLGQQSKMQSSELLEVPHVWEQAAILGAILVDEGHRGSGWAHAGHGDTSFWRPCSAHRVPNMTNEGLDMTVRSIWLLFHITRRLESRCLSAAARRQLALPG